MPAWAAGNTKCKVRQSEWGGGGFAGGERTVSYLEVKDDGPYEAECKLGVAVYNVLSSDVDEFDFFVT